MLQSFIFTSMFLQSEEYIGQLSVPEDSEARIDIIYSFKSWNWGKFSQVGTLGEELDEAFILRFDWLDEFHLV